MLIQKLKNREMELSWRPCIPEVEVSRRVKTSQSYIDLGYRQVVSVEHVYTQTILLSYPPLMMSCLFFAHPSQVTEDESRVSVASGSNTAGISPSLDVRELDSFLIQSNVYAPRIVSSNVVLYSPRIDCTWLISLHVHA
jgi:hypothetical protein